MDCPGVGDLDLQLVHDGLPCGRGQRRRGQVAAARLLLGRGREAGVIHGVRHPQLHGLTGRRLDSHGVADRDTEQSERVTSEKYFPRRWWPAALLHRELGHPHRVVGRRHEHLERDILQTPVDLDIRGELGAPGRLDDTRPGSRLGHDRRHLRGVDGLVEQDRRRRRLGAHVRAAGLPAAGGPGEEHPAERCQADRDRDHHRQQPGPGRPQVPAQLHRQQAGHADTPAGALSSDTTRPSIRVTSRPTIDLMSRS